MLCGTMFGLKIIKHRYFECSFPVQYQLCACDHRGVYDPWHSKGRSVVKMREAQETPWIPAEGGASRKRGRSGDVNNAIPPRTRGSSGLRLRTTFMLIVHPLLPRIDGLALLSRLTRGAIDVLDLGIYPYVALYLEWSAETWMNAEYGLN